MFEQACAAQCAASGERTAGDIPHPPGRPSHSWFIAEWRLSLCLPYCHATISGRAPSRRRWPGTKCL